MMPGRGGQRERQPSWRQQAPFHKTLKKKQVLKRLEKAMKKRFLGYGKTEERDKGSWSSLLPIPCWSRDGHFSNQKTGKKAFVIAIAGMILPFFTGFAFSFLLHKERTNGTKEGTFVLFLGVALSVTAFPVLARILAELKLINTELGFITDAIGTHSVFGAFVFGLVIPNGPLGVTLIEKLEDFVSGLLLPLFFAMSGLKTNVGVIHGTTTWGLLALVIFLGIAGKVAGTIMVTIFYQMPIREGLTLGLLMNTKGLIEMIILNVGKDQRVLDDNSFAIMVIVAVVMTGLVTPIVTTIYKPTRKFIPYKRRTIQRSKPDAELRILVCVHTPRNVPTIINLLEASQPTKRSPMCVYVLHLVELTGRASAMLIVHSTRKSGRPALNRTQAQSDHIINAFENYEQHAVFVSVQPLTAISPYSTMHEDICNLAEDKRVAFIIIPFHKQQTVDGGMEATNPAFRMVNQNVLANSPCSVGILVDRGLSGSTRLATNQISHNVAVLFFGGPDDREALSYAWRMSEQPG
ncbi:hypothetical protein GH714_021900 [Hevea brasiliensis]|uniref:Uncharacterized protein n=1 Tax=Hevea brasiliensis TaxID=3981 RepID=A0A6A6K8D6_HEVBR|nr:hypothetical protein GH714_021900 [Hevea brasiliensis]